MRLRIVSLDPHPHRVGTVWSKNGGIIAFLEFGVNTPFENLKAVGSGEAWGGERGGARGGARGEVRV